MRILNGASRHSTETSQRLYRDLAESRDSQDTLQSLYRDFTKPYRGSLQRFYRYFTDIVQILSRDSSERHQNFKKASLQKLCRDFIKGQRDSDSETTSEFDIAFCIVDRQEIQDSESFKLLGSVAAII